MRRWRFAREERRHVSSRDGCSTLNADIQQMMSFIISTIDVKGTHEETKRKEEHTREQGKEPNRRESLAQEVTDHKAKSSEVQEPKSMVLASTRTRPARSSFQTIHERSLGSRRRPQRPRKHVQVRA